MATDGKSRPGSGAAPEADLDAGSPGALRSDAEIAVAVARALQLSARLSGNSVHGAVTNGHVTLWGEVDWEHQREAAAVVTRWLNGVTGVTNRTRFRSRDRFEDPSPRLNSITRVRSRIGQTRNGKA